MEGYQPNQGHLDNSNPPQGGSGVTDTLKAYCHICDKEVVVTKEESRNDFIFRCSICNSQKDTKNKGE